jgi:hypothetical protein
MLKRSRGVDFHAAALLAKVNSLDCLTATLEFFDLHLGLSTSCCLRREIELDNKVRPLPEGLLIDVEFPPCQTLA